MPYFDKSKFVMNVDLHFHCTLKDLVVPQSWTVPVFLFFLLYPEVQEIQPHHSGLVHLSHL